MIEQLRYDGQVVVVTGAGSGLGKEYAAFFASRGASVVVNDLGGSSKGEGSNAKAADQVAEEIHGQGGIAVPNYDSVEHGEKIVQTAIDHFGRIDVLINNAGILRDVSFQKMTDQDWDLIMSVHLRGVYKTTRAAWPYFRKQRYGRIINTSSASGLFGNFGQVNYGAAKMALVGFTETLAIEGVKYNILANVLAPAAATRLTATVKSQDLLDKMHPKYVTPLVAILVHKSNTSETGGIFEAGAGNFAKLRWERAEGAFMRPDDTFTPEAALDNLQKMSDFTNNVQYPRATADAMSNLEKAINLSENRSTQKLDFSGKVALITGGANGLGRAYALLLAKKGAKVVVNDLTNPDIVAQEIRSAGGEAIAVKASVEDGDKIVRSAVDSYGRLDIIINNGGILRDKSFVNMADHLWDEIIRVHLRGTYKVTKAAWPYMVKQRYGRIVNTASTNGIYGNFGQANYSAAKAGVIGFTRALAREGQRYNIKVNVIAPSSGTRFIRSTLPDRPFHALKPELVAPVVVALSSDSPKVPNARLYEVASGWSAEVRYQRTGGHQFPQDQELTPEAVLKVFDRVVTFDARADHPENMEDGRKLWQGSLPNTTKVTTNYNEKIEAVQKLAHIPTEFTYTTRDVILYHLGIGATASDLPFVFEGHPHFQTIPTFGVVPPYYSVSNFQFGDVVPNYDLRRVLHGEQYLEIGQYPIPTAATLISSTYLIEIIDKGNAAIVRRGCDTKDSRTGKRVFYNENTIFVRGCGGFGGAAKGTDRGAATALNIPPSRKPDFVHEEYISKDLAAIYRLSGDKNPLHIDPAFAKGGGLSEPILHGLASFGICGKHLYSKYGPFANIKVRFAGTVLPGQTLVTEAWKQQGRKVLFQVRVKETGKLAISNAGVELWDAAKANL